MASIITRIVPRISSPSRRLSNNTILQRSAVLYHGNYSQNAQYSITIDNNSTLHRKQKSKSSNLLTNISPAFNNVRYSSQSTENFTYIPTPPEVSTVTENLSTLADSLLEPTFVSQGLGGYTPVGILQTCFEFMHINAGMPWWMTIVVGTAVIRLCMIPLVIKSQKYAGKMHQHMPQMKILQENMMEARRSGDRMLTIKASNDLALFTKEKEINPLKQLMVPLCQAPIFISFFIGLRGMANLPIESMKGGGLFWFTDLTIADPYCIMPIITSATLLLTIEVGAEGMRSDTLGLMKYVFRAMPLVILPFTINFPAAILCYWMTSNMISLTQVAILKIPALRTYFGIPAIVKHAPSSHPALKQKGFIESIKSTYSNQKLIQQVEDRKRIDEIKYRKAGMGPIQKTYPYDPTKQKMKVK